MDLIPYLQPIATFSSGAISNVVTALLTAFYLRGNSKTTEFEKIKAGKFSEVLDNLLSSGKMSYMELYKCKNFLSIAKKADEICLSSKSSEEDASNGNATNDFSEDSTSYDFDWFIRFFDSAGNVSNEKMQQLWSRLLAGKINRTGSFSLRSIETLYNMSQSEAELFRIAASISLTEYGGSRIIYRSEYDDFATSEIEINEKYGLGAEEFSILEECGLLSSLKQESYSTTIEGCTGIYTDNIILTFEKNNNFDYNENEEPIFEYNSYMLTQTALQLLPIIQAESNDDYIIDLGLYLKKRNPKFIVKAYYVTDILENGNIACDISEDLLENISD